MINMVVYRQLSATHSLRWNYVGTKAKILCSLSLPNVNMQIWKIWGFRFRANVIVLSFQSIEELPLSMAANQNYTQYS